MCDKKGLIYWLSIVGPLADTLLIAVNSIINIFKKGK